VHITRTEFDRAVNSINENIHDLKIQFHRIADLQAEIDALKRAVEKLTR